MALGIGLICAGLLSIYNRLLHWFWRNDILPLWLADFLDYLPSLLLSFAVIALGVWLVRGKRMPADRVEDYPQYGEREDSRKEKRHDKRSA